MDNQKLEIKVALKMQKPLHEVFEAIVDPSKMSNYFIKKSTGRIEEDKTLTWSFPEFDMEFPMFFFPLPFSISIISYFE